MARSHWILPALFVLLGGLGAAPAVARPGDSARRPDCYVLRDGNSTTISNMDIGENGILLEKLSGDYLWFRRAGRTGLIVDPSTLQEAHALFEPLRALQPEQEDLRRREEALEEKEQQLDEQEEAIDRRMDLASEQDADDDSDDIEDGEQNADAVAPLSDAERQAIDAELAQLRERQRELQVQSRELDRVERALDQREDAIEREAEAKLWALIDASVENGVAKPSPKS